MKGLAHRGNQLAFGSFGIKSLESKWITGRQIEAARVAVTRYMQRQGRSQPRCVWVKVKVILRDSYRQLLQAVSSSRLRA
mgnify:CR=1 FL=1